MAANNSQKKSKKQMWLWVVIALLIILLILGVTLGLYYSLKEAPGGDNGNGNGNGNDKGDITVTWKDGDNVLEVDEGLKVGDMPHYDGPIVVNQVADEEWLYDFGWDKPLEPVTQSITFQTVFERKPNNLRYEYNDAEGYYSVVGFKEGHEEDKEVIIGSTYHAPDGPEAPIGAVGEAAFRPDMGLSTVERILIADSVQNIAARAFNSGSSMTTIDWSVDHSQLSVIGDEAFTQINVRDLVLPAALTELGIATFENIDSHSVTFAAGVKVLPTNAFAFSANLQAITLPSDLEQIGAEAFNQCSNLSEITIPRSVKEIDQMAFVSCGLKTVNFAEDAELERLGNNVFSGNFELAAIVLPDSLTEWGEDMFLNCTALESAVISAGVTNIPGDAFNGCTALQAIYIPDNITTIGYGAFTGSGLINVYIPISVTTVEGPIFANCENLEAISSGVATPADNSNVPEGWAENWLEDSNITTVDWNQPRP